MLVSMPAVAESCSATCADLGPLSKKPDGGGEIFGALGDELVWPIFDTFDGAHRPSSFRDCESGRGGAVLGQKSTIEVKGQVSYPYLWSKCDPPFGR